MTKFSGPGFGPLTKDLMSDKSLKRYKNDERKQHIDKLTGKPIRRVREEHKVREADAELKQYKYKKEEQPECE